MAAVGHATLEKIPSRSSGSLEKGSVTHVSSPDVEVGETHAVDLKETMRKVDVRLLPILGLLYAFSLMDRNNLGLARIVGAGEELKLNIGSRYSICSLIFFVPYAALEWASNIVLRKISAALLLSGIATFWGFTMLGMGFVKNWQALAGCRAIIGALEAGFFPGCVYLISSWYVRREQQSRLAFFYLSATLVSAFNPILCYGISTIGVVYGLKAWRWIFIIYGCITAFLGIISYWLIADFPDKAKFLTKEEIAVVTDRIDKDRGDSVPDSLTWQKAFNYILDWKLWSFALMYSSSTLVPYAYASFLPIILHRGMGFNLRDAQILGAPPSVFTVFAGMAVAHFADKSGVRGPWIVGQASITIVGLCMTGFTSHNAVRYIGTFLGMFGGLSNIPAILAYSMNNITGYSKRSYTSALVSAFGGIGGIVAGAAFREKDSPNYVPGIWTAIGFQLMTIVLVIITSSHFAYKNRQVRRGLAPAIENTPGFFYTL